MFPEGSLEPTPSGPRPGATGSSNSPLLPLPPSLPARITHHRWDATGCRLGCGVSGPEQTGVSWPDLGGSALCQKEKGRPWSERGWGCGERTLLSRACGGVGWLDMEQRPAPSLSCCFHPTALSSPCVSPSVKGKGVRKRSCPSTWRKAFLSLGPEFLRHGPCTTLWFTPHTQVTQEL